MMDAMFHGNEIENGQEEHEPLVISWIYLNGFTRMDKDIVTDAMFHGNESEIGLKEHESLMISWIWQG